jgi:PIN like domain
LKIAFDENVPIAMVKVFQTFANERQLRRKIGTFEITRATQYTPKPAEDDFRKKNDAPWIKRFAAAGGKVIVSGDTEMRYVPHERLALIQAGMLVFFFDGKWSQWDFFRKCSLLIHHWPAIAARIKRGKAPAFWHVPLSWNEKAKLRKVSTDDPKKLKLERKAKPQRPARKSPATKKVQPPAAREPTLLDLMVAPANERE